MTLEQLIKKKLHKLPNKVVKERVFLLQMNPTYFVNVRRNWCKEY